MTNRKSSIIGKILRGTLVLIGFLVLAFGVFWIWGMPKSDMRGQWRTEGYGIVVDIGRFAIDLREITPVSCERYGLAPANLWLLKNLGGIEFKMVGEGLVVREASTVNPIGTKKIAAMPDVCVQNGQRDADDPEWNFEVFWNAFDGHYPFFDLYGVDWDARYAEFRPQVTPATTPDELFQILRGLVHGLEDGHIYFADQSGQRGHSPDPGVAWYNQMDEARQVAKSYLSDEVIGVGETGLSYGWLAGEIGYIRLSHMGAEVPFGASRAEAVRPAIEQAAHALADAKGIIVDIRFNGGGDDAISLTYAGAFTDRPVEAFSKVTKTLDGFSEPYSAYATPNGNVFLDQPVVLLTSGFSASAAEIFTMAMREMPQVTVLGQATSGEHSDVLTRNLPNGWEVGLSHQIYRTPDGTVFEGSGLPPDHFRSFDAAGFSEGKDSLLEEAMAMLGG